MQTAKFFTPMNGVTCRLRFQGLLTFNLLIPYCFIVVVVLSFLMDDVGHLEDDRFSFRAANLQQFSFHAVINLV